MKKQNVLNLIKYHVEKNENAFRNEAVSIAKYFDAIGDYQLAAPGCCLKQRGRHCSYAQ